MACKIQSSYFNNQIEWLIVHWRHECDILTALYIICRDYFHLHEPVIDMFINNF